MNGVTEIYLDSNSLTEEAIQETINLQETQANNWVAGNMALSLDKMKTAIEKEQEKLKREYEERWGVGPLAFARNLLSTIFSQAYFDERTIYCLKQAQFGN